MGFVLSSDFVNQVTASSWDFDLSTLFHSRSNGVTAAQCWFSILASIPSSGRRCSFKILFFSWRRSNDMFCFLWLGLAHRDVTITKILKHHQRQDDRCRENGTFLSYQCLSLYIKSSVKLNVWAFGCLALLGIRLKIHMFIIQNCSSFPDQVYERLQHPIRAKRLVTHEVRNFTKTKIRLEASEPRLWIDKACLLSVHQARRQHDLIIFCIK
jgi:hypothetical protein